MSNIITGRNGLTFIDDKVYWCRLIDGGVKLDGKSEWDRWMKLIGRENVLGHYRGNRSWTMTESPDHQDCHCTRGGEAADGIFTDTPDEELHAFRPVLVPLNPEDMTADWMQIADIKDGERLVFGSLYVNDRHVIVPEVPSAPTQEEGGVQICPPNAEIMFRDTQKKDKYNLRWIKWERLLICDRNILAGVSWNTLAQNGFCQWEPKWNAKKC